MPRVVVRSAKDFGLALSAARRARQLSQAEVAEATAIERTYLARLESGPATIQLERIMRVLRRLGAEVAVTIPDAGEQP